MKNIFFNYADRQIKLKDSKKLKLFISGIFNDHNIHLKRLDFIFCGDEYLRKLNREFLDHDYYTDILTFPLSDIPDELAAEIYISIERVKDNARKFHVFMHREMVRVMFHGALHLCGFDDKGENKKSKMTEKEDFYLAGYFNTA